MNMYIFTELINELNNDFMETSWESGYGLSFQFKVLKLDFCVCMEILEERGVFFLLDDNIIVCLCVYVCMCVLSQSESL